MKNEKINTTLQNENAEKNTANEKWETPKFDVIAISMDTQAAPPNFAADGGFAS